MREERAKAPAPPKAKAVAAPPQGKWLGAQEAQPAQAQAGRGAAGLEAEIEAAEAALRAIEDELSDPAAWATPEASARSSARHEEAKLKVAELYERWEAVAG